jgi:hypothetical protein
MTANTGDNRFGMPTWIVCDPDRPWEGTHTTLTAALAVASSGDSVGIKPGLTLTENVTVPAGVNIVGSPVGFVNLPQVIGKITVSSGICNISGLQLTTDGDYAISVTGTGSVNLTFCFLEGADNTIIEMTSSGSLRILDSNLNLNTTGIAYHTQTAGSIRYRRVSGSNVLNSTTQSTSSSASALFLEDGLLPILVSMSDSSLLQTRNFQFGDSSTNSIGLTTADTSTALLRSGTIASGSAAAVSAGAGTTVTIDQITISSTNSNPVTGAGTVVYGLIEFRGTGQGENVTTHTRRPIAVGSISFDGNTNKLQNYAEGTWTPDITGSGSNPTVAYTTQLGKYTRIGDAVFVKFSIEIDTISGGSGNVQIEGFPFTSANDGMSSSNNLTTSGVLYPTDGLTLSISLGPNTDVATIVADLDNASGTLLQVSDLANGDVLIGTLTYWV